MSSIDFKSLVGSCKIWAYSTMLLSIHHLHHHSHWAWILADHNSWCVFKSLWKSNFLNSRLKFILKPETEGGNVIFRNSASCYWIIRLTKILLNFIISCFYVYESLSFVISSLLETKFINVIGKKKNWYISSLEGFHEGWCQGLINAGVNNEVNLILSGLQFLNIVFKRDEVILRKSSVESKELKQGFWVFMVWG